MMRILKLNKEEDDKEEDDKEFDDTTSPGVNPYMQTDHDTLHIEDTTTLKLTKAKQELKAKRRFDYKWYHIIPYTRFIIFCK